jgi:hypothetical protein
MHPASNIRKYENFHIFLWLIKDLCWVTVSRMAGMFMILPTLSLAIYITWINRSERAELFHNLAVCFWICANSIWMFGEFYLEDNTRNPAIIFFVAGLLSMGYYYLIEVLGTRKGRIQNKS